MRGAIEPNIRVFFHNSRLIRQIQQNELQKFSN